MTGFTELNINPDRILEAVSKIGYRPPIALMDIIDNSIAAFANKIDVILDLEEGKKFHNRSAIKRFILVDNGKGMTNAEVQTALDIGSNVKYPPHSLSKFGLGLKSAGLSLGDRIYVVSKQDGKLTNAKYIDREVVRSEGSYGLVEESPEPRFADLLTDYQSGTVVVIEKPAKPQDSPKKIINELDERAGIVYYEKLGCEGGVEIKIKCGDDAWTVNGFDILCSEEARNSFDPDVYDPRYPVLAIDEDLDDPLDPEKSPRIKVRAAIFPQNKMGNYPGFSVEEKKKINSYKIKRDTSGVFVFRNGRAIRCGDLLAGITKDDIGFRVKISLQDEHDDSFRIDVSKQNVEYPEEFEENLKRLFRVPLGQAREAFKICRRLLDSGDDAEGHAVSERLEDFDEDASDSESDVPPGEQEIRERDLVDSSKAEQEEEVVVDESEDNIAEVNSGERAETEESEFAKVRYSETVTGSYLYRPGMDTYHGTFVRISKSHPFYDTVLSQLPAADTTRQSVEAIIFILASVYNSLYKTESKVTTDDLERLLNKHSLEVSQRLERWILQNQDLFE
ncbi:ATP-binding protein [Spiribacter insolitus]|uniref:ATP-binding protein n=1 Tax=Spiribacter insolitus TaxID=3122417 RepID=A0ABV3T5A2_9GAMM